MNLSNVIFNDPKTLFKNKVTYIVGRDEGIERLFKELTGVEPLNVFNPIEAVGVLPDPDILVFTGGHDVSPIFYKEKNIHSSCSLQRDMTEFLWWSLYKEKKEVVKVGICRGAQFLNVMNGGRLVQHLDPGHAETHLVTHHVWKPYVTKWVGDSFEVNSTHHQGIVGGLNSHVLLRHQGLGTVESIVYLPKVHDSLSFCFQPHPEYGHVTTTEAFCSLLQQAVEYTIAHEGIWKPKQQKKVRA